MPITAQPIGQWLWDLFKDFEEDAELKKRWPYFRFMCVVAGTCYPPRHEKWDYLRDMGCAHIDTVLFHKKGLPDGNLLFVFPDNHMIPGESQYFMHRLNTHPDWKKRKGPRRDVLVVTSQPYIVSDCAREQVRVLSDGGQHLLAVRAKD